MAFRDLSPMTTQRLSRSEPGNWHYLRVDPEGNGFCPVDTA